MIQQAPFGSENWNGQECWELSALQAEILYHSNSGPSKFFSPSRNYNLSAPADILFS